MAGDVRRFTVRRVDGRWWWWPVALVVGWWVGRMYRDRQQGMCWFARWTDRTQHMQPGDRWMIYAGYRLHDREAARDVVAVSNCATCQHMQSRHGVRMGTLCHQASSNS